VCDSMEEACITLTQFQVDHPSVKYHIEKCEGVRARCEGWCSVNKFCASYQEYKSKNNESD
jgi:hypothetical protein